MAAPGPALGVRAEAVRGRRGGEGGGNGDGRHPGEDGAVTRVRVSVRVSVCPPQPSLRPSVERYLRERPEVAMLLRGLLRCDPQTRPHPHSNPDPPPTPGPHS